MALYVLAKWIKMTGGFYPNEPTTGQMPQKPPSRKARRDVAGAVDVVGTHVTQGDDTDLAAALHVDVSDASTALEYTGDDLDCDDLVMDANNNTSCNTADNSPLVLDGTLNDSTSSSSAAAKPTTTTPTSTSTAAPRPTCATWKDCQNAGYKCPNDDWICVTTTSPGLCGCTS
jgi:hypothetical protein